MVRISDARTSSASFGTVALHVAPNPPSADRSRRSAPATKWPWKCRRRIDLLVPADQIARRLAGFHPAPSHYDRGYGRLLLDHVT